MDTNKNSVSRISSRGAHLTYYNYKNNHKRSYSCGVGGKIFKMMALTCLLSRGSKGFVCVPRVTRQWASVPRMTALFSTLSDVEIAQVEEQIQAKGNEIRQYKADGMDKTALAPHIQELLALKAKIAPPEDEQKKKKPQKQKPQKKQQPQNKKKKVEEMSESELRQARLGKVQAMREANVEPYAYTYDRTLSSGQLHEFYEGKLEGGEEDESADVAVAGRIMAKRVFGKLAFFTLQDETSTIQLH